MKVDVFLSFRGIDTRRTFVSHLLLSLFKKQIKTFKVEEEIPQMQPATSKVLQVIQEDSRIAIVVISKNYTASISCLDELTMIIECKEKRSLVVIPVLYEVDPSDVLRQANDLESHGNGDNVKKWKDAVAKLIQIYHQDFSYWEVEDSYSYIIDRIMIYVSSFFSSEPYALREPLLAWSQASLSKVTNADDEHVVAVKEECFNLIMSLLLFPIGIVTKGISLVRTALGKITGRFMNRQKRISFKPNPAGSYVDVQKEKYAIHNELSRFVLSNDFNSFVGMDRHMKAVNALLDSQLDAKLGGFGICGGHGVGKSTLARCVYEQISPQFQDHYYFLMDAKNYSPCLLEEITRAALIPPSDSELKRLEEDVKAKLRHRKVLLIVDELYLISQLENIRKFSRLFGPGSRLILLSECREVLGGRVKNIYEVESMRYDEALQLFSRFAFRQEQVRKGFYRLSVRAVLLTGRIPLAIKLFGSFLFGKCINEWESELYKLEALQENCIARVSSYIGDAFS